MSSVEEPENPARSKKSAGGRHDTSTDELDVSSEAASESATESAALVPVVPGAADTVVHAVPANGSPTTESPETGIGITLDRSLCACLDDKEVCIMGSCCPCVLYGQNRERAGLQACLPAAMMVVIPMAICWIVPPAYTTHFTYTMLAEIGAGDTSTYDALVECECGYDNNWRPGTLTSNGSMCTWPSPWTVESGSCETDGACITSPNYPNNYGSSQSCSMRSSASGLLTCEAYDTESEWDHLDVGGRSYSGQDCPSGYTQDGEMHWHTDGSVTHSGFRICLREHLPHLSRREPVSSEYTCIAGASYFAFLCLIVVPAVFAIYVCVLFGKNHSALQVALGQANGGPMNHVMYCTPLSFCLLSPFFQCGLCQVSYAYA